jgi:2-amino-4-hydroxy-6-hydroxymethyldihydropteridine diphosphokinase
MKENNIAYVSIGSNIGNRYNNFKKALAKIKLQAQILKFSSIYETEPEDFLNQRNFLNMIVKVKTAFKALDFLNILLNIEKEMGRKKIIEKGPRIIDLDLLFFNNLNIRKKNIELPHPRLHKRNFVLTPLIEIEPDLIHHELNKSIKELKINLKNPGKVKLWTKKKLEN